MIRGFQFGLGVVLALLLAYVAVSFLDSYPECVRRVEAGLPVANLMCGWAFPGAWE